MKINMEPQIELHLLNERLKLMSVKKCALHKLAFPIFKIAFTNKTECKLFSFSETNDDYTIITDNVGLNEIEPFIDSDHMIKNESNWIPMILCGEDLSGSMSISKISKYVILPLADYKISILAISMYQSDYILIQEKDYKDVIKCLSNHIPKIFDESLRSENGTAKILPRKKELTSIESKSAKPLNITLPLTIPEESDYCITGLYNQEAFSLIIPTLIEIMFYETENYEGNEIFFNFIKKENDISLVMETRLLKKFPMGALLNIENDYWKMIRIGKESVAINVYGVCASVSQPLEKACIDEYYISSFHTGYCFIPSNELSLAKELFEKQSASIKATSTKRTRTRSEMNHKNIEKDFDSMTLVSSINNDSAKINDININFIEKNLIKSTSLTNSDNQLNNAI